MSIEKSFEAHGLPCLVAINDGLGNYCGYVGVSKDHPWYGKTYAQIEKLDNYPDVHGGVTFADHIPGQSDDVWWLGFDCGHYGDYVPYLAQSMAVPVYGGHKWTVDEVADETRRLAKQLAEVDA